MSRPLVSLLIPCRNEKDHVESCIRALGAQDLLPGSFEVIVADGLSDDGTRDILMRLAEECSWLRVVDNPGRIVSTGLNLAIQKARGEIIVRIDVHTEYARDYVKQCIAVLQETGADNVGGPWVAKGTGYIGRAIAAAFQSPFAAGGARGHDPHYSGPVDTVYLGCWRRQVFARYGFFDETLVRNQDDEFNLRLSRAGGLVWQSARIKSWYHPRESLGSLFRQYAQYGYWKVRVIQKHRLPASLRHLVPALFVLLMIVLAGAAPFWSPALWVGSALGITYSLGNLIASVETARRAECLLFPVLPIVFACYHLGYGYGFLRGMIDFLICHRTPLDAMATLTRSAKSPSPQSSQPR